MPILSLLNPLDQRLGEWHKVAEQVRSEQQDYDRVPIQERGGLPRVVWVEGVKFWLGAAGEFRKSWDTFMRRSLPAVTQPDAPEATQKPASTLPQQFWQSARAIPSAIRQSQAPIPVLWKNFTQWLGSLPPLMPGGLFVRFPTIAGSLSNASSATDPIGYAYLITRLRIDEMGRTQGESRDRIHRAISDLEKNKAITQSLSFYFRKYPYARFATTMSSLVVALADMNVLERELYVKQLHVWDRMYPDVSPVVFRDLVEHLHAAPAELRQQYIDRYIAEWTEHGLAFQDVPGLIDALNTLTAPEALAVLPYITQWRQADGRMVGVSRIRGIIGALHGNTSTLSRISPHIAPWILATMPDRDMKAIIGRLNEYPDELGVLLPIVDTWMSQTSWITYDLFKDWLTQTRWEIKSAQRDRDNTDTRARIAATLPPHVIAPEDFEHPIFDYFLKTFVQPEAAMIGMFYRKFLSQLHSRKSYEGKCMAVEGHEPEVSDIDGYW